MMSNNGLSKLTEEMGELQQVVGKMLAYGPGTHPDGTESLLQKYEEEAADVLASINFVTMKWGADVEKIRQRAKEKLRKFEDWHRQP